MQAPLTIRQEAVPIVKASLQVRRKSLEFSLRQCGRKKRNTAKVAIVTLSGLVP